MLLKNKYPDINKNTISCKSTNKFENLKLFLSPLNISKIKPMNNPIIKNRQKFLACSETLILSYIPLFKKFI